MSGQEASKQPVYKIGTRKSNLAMWQANYVHSVLCKAHPDSIFEVVGIATVGDKDQIKPLAEFEAKGLFTKELDVAQLTGDIDIAVHCMKDLPTELPPGIVIAATLERGDVDDAVVMHAKHQGKTMKDLPAGSIIGTSSMRRCAMMGRKFPGLVFKNIRGNLNTRLAKLDAGGYDAIILAQIGLKRLEFADRISEVLSPAEYGYAVGQGALAISVREGDAKTAALLRSLQHPATNMSCLAERGMLKTLNGGCKVPITVRCDMSESKEDGITISLWGAVLSLDGKEMVESTVSAKGLGKNPQEDAKTAWAIGVQLGMTLKEKGAAEILKDIPRCKGGMTSS